LDFSAFQKKALEEKLDSVRKEREEMEEMVTKEDKQIIKCKEILNGLKWKAKEKTQKQGASLIMATIIMVVLGLFMGTGIIGIAAAAPEVADIGTELIGMNWMMGVGLLAVVGLVGILIWVIRKRMKQDKINWQRVKSELMKGKFWTGLFRESISRYPEPLSLADVVKFILSFIAIFATFAAGNLFTTGFSNLIYSIQFGLMVVILYFSLSTIRNWFTDKAPHFEKGFKQNIKKLLNRKHIHPGKHSRAIFTVGVGSPLFVVISFVVFYILTPFSGSLLWILLATVLLSNFGGIYDSYMRGKQYPEPRIRRDEYIKNYVLTFAAVLVTFFIAPNPLLYLISRRIFSEIIGAIIDLRSSFRIYEITKGFKVALPGKKIPIHRPGEITNIEVEGKEGFYEGEDGWKQKRGEKAKGLKEKRINSLLTDLEGGINKVFPHELTCGQELKEFAEAVV
jgi:hypothetical protein